MSFYPRAREGRDSSGGASAGGGTSFYPRAREGRDLNAHFNTLRVNVSIRAPVKDATGFSGLSAM